jgi:hypothetical protein
MLTHEIVGIVRLGEILTTPTPTGDCAVCTLSPVETPSTSLGRVHSFANPSPHPFGLICTVEGITGPLGTAGPLDTVVAIGEQQTSGEIGSHTSDIVSDQKRQS